jgi:hypothetical protein
MMVHAKQRRNGTETTKPQVEKVSFNHYALRQFCEFEEDMEIIETIFIYVD